MAYNNGIDGKALLDEISKVIDAAANQYHEAGEDAGEEYIKGVVDGIKKHSKEAKSEITKIYEDFNKTTNNFKTRKKELITQAEWTRVLGLSKELMKSERYADNVREKFSDISVTLKNGIKASGLEKVLEEWEKVGGLVESVSWSEAGKNYRKKPSTRKPATKSPKVEDPVVQGDPAPVVKAEEKKQEAIRRTTKEMERQAKTAKEINHALDVKNRYTGASLKGKSDFVNAIKYEWGRGNKAVSVKLFEQYKERFPKGTYDPSTDKKFGADWSNNYNQYLEQANRHLAEMDNRLEGITVGVIESQGEFKKLADTIAESRDANLSGVDLSSSKFYSNDKYDFTDTNISDAEAQLEAARQKAQELKEEAMAAKEAFDEVSSIRSQYTGKYSGKSDLQAAIKDEWSKGNKAVAAKLYEQYQTRFPKGLFDPSKQKMFGDDWINNHEKYLEQANRHIVELDTILNGMAADYGKYEAYSTLDFFVKDKTRMLDNMKQNKLVGEVVKNDLDSRREVAKNKYATDDAAIAQENLNNALEEFTRRNIVAKNLLEQRNKMIQALEDGDASGNDMFAGYETPAKAISETSRKFSDANLESYRFAAIDLKEAVRVAKELGVEVNETALGLDDIEKTLVNDMLMRQKRFAMDNEKAGTTEKSKKIFDADKIEEHTAALREQESVAEKTAKAQEKYSQRMSEIKDKYNDPIKEKKALISNQEAWIKYLNGSLDESKFKTTGKKAATDQLRSLTHYMTNNRQNNYQNAPGEYAKEMAEVAWMRGYQEAERQGVADSVLNRYDSDAKYDFERNLKTLQDHFDYRKKTMDDAYAELQRLYLERDKEAFSAFADHLMPEGPQSDEESRILSKITEQVANKTLDYGDAKVNLEKSIMTLRNMASSETKINLQNLVNDLKKTYDTETFDKVFGTDFSMFASFDKIDDTGAKELYDMLIESNKEYQASLVKTTDAQKEFNKQVKDGNIVYHAGDLSNPSKTMKSLPLGNVAPSRGRDSVFNGFTGLYTTEDVDGFWGNEWDGAPISSIDLSHYKMFDARNDELAKKAQEFFGDLNSTIYGYHRFFDFEAGEMKTSTDVKTVEALYDDFKTVFKNIDLDFESFKNFVEKSKTIVEGHKFEEIEVPDIDMGIAKSNAGTVLQGVSQDVFNSDSFQTQLLKMLGFEGIDLRDTKFNGTYTGGTVIFDVKPESIKTTNEKWSDVMARNGYEISETNLQYEEKRRQLAFDTAKAYSKIAEESNETKNSPIVEEATNNELKETFDIIQQGESITGKFVTTANTVHEALENMRNALPEEKQAWGEYIDNILAQDDNKMVGAFKSISGSMGGRSELYKLENLGDGRVAVTFTGIREEIEATTDTAEQSKKSLQDVLELIDKMSSESGDSDAFNKRHKVLIDKSNNLTSGVDYDQLYSQLIENENKYQQELEETNRINKEREGQLDAYAQAAGAFLGDSKYDGVSFDDKSKLFENFGNKIMQDGLSASDAMDQLYLSMEKLIQQSKEMPDDIIESFGAENEHVAETVSQLQKLSSIDLTRIFDSVDLKSFLQAFNIDQSNFAAFRKLFEELMQITNAMANGVDVGNAFNLKMDEITNTIMRLGGNMLDLDDAGYATMMQDFYKHMSNTKVQFNDAIKADYTKDQWKSLYSTYKNRLTADVTKGIPADSLYHELSGLWPSLFPEGVLNEKDQFKLIIEKLDEARRLQADNWKILQGFTPENRDDIQNSVDNLYNQMSQSLYADTSANELQSEANAFKEVEQSATKAANAKGKFSKKNKELGDGAAESSDDLDDEAESLENVNIAAANLPDVSAYDSTTVRYDANGNPYNVSGTSRQEMIDGTHIRSTDNYQFDAENNRWDYMGTVQTAERTREMVQALEEYYRILNQIQKLRLDPSNAIHTEEINKLETDDLARAYQRVCDLDIQINDIEGQINLSVNQRRALLDVELRARQEMYDVIAKMEDKQATAATKPFQKTVADEIKKAANIDTNVRLLGDDGASDRLQSQIADYRRLVNELVDMRLQLARNSDLANDVDFSNRFADTVKRAENARVAIEGIFKESQKLQKLGTFIAAGKKDVSNVQNLKSEMIEFAISALDGEVKINGFNKEGTRMYATLTQAGGAVEHITVAMHDASGKLQAFRTGTSQATNEWEDFKTKAVDGVKNIVGMYVGFQEGVQAFRTGLEYVKEIDLAMTELKKVTDETDASYKQFLQDASGTAAIIGSTISDFTEATATFARLGYSMEESSSMAETAIIYRNVADGLDTVEEASQSIISTMAAFGIESNNTMSIIDKFNEVGNNFSITSAGIGDALQRSASALYASGNTIDESIALITAANQVVQNPEVVGTAFKTLSLRLRGAKTELEEAGLETDAMAESTSQLQEKLNALTGGKVNIMADADTFKSTTQILREMATVWDEMSDIDQAAALELMGGKRQANVLASLLNNFETVENAIETSMNSSGSAMAENEKWLDSIEGKTYQFTNALQTMWSNMLDSEVIKGFLDFGTGAIQILDTTAGKVIAFVAALKLAAKFKGFSIKGIAKGLGDTINQITTSQQTLQALSQTTQLGKGYDFTNVNAYAQAVANLTAKQQANLLASQGLNQEQIRYALTLNQVDDAAMREAMAHVHAASAKDQEAMSGNKLIQQKALEVAASLKVQAAKDGETRSTELNAAADILEQATSEELTKDKLVEIMTSKGVNSATQAEILAKLGLTNANKGLAASIKALYVLNPVGFWITVGSTILSLIPIAGELVDAFTKSSEEIRQEADEISQTYSDAVNEINNNLQTLGITSDTSSIIALEKEFATLTAGVDRYGNNISLTSDEYERYKEICEQVVGINPRIASGYDSATEAIGNNAGVLSQLIELQKEQARIAAETYVNDENLETLSKDAVNDYNDTIKKHGSNVVASKEELFGMLDQGSTQETMEYILRTLGYTEAEITNKIAEYYLSDVHDYDSFSFITDFIDKIGDNSSKFTGYTKDLDKFFIEYENTIATGEQSIKEAQDGLIDTLLIVPKSDKDYDKLSSEGKNFLSDWINNSDMFKMDASTTAEDVQKMRDSILDMIDVLVNDVKNISYNGKQLSAQDILDQVYNFDLSSASYDDYKTKIDSMLTAFWNSIGGEKNNLGFKTFDDFKISLGFNFEETDKELEKDKIQVANYLETSTEEVQKYLDNMSAAEIKAFYSIDWNNIDPNNINNWQDVMEEIRQQMQGSTLSIDTYSTLADGVSSYNEILIQTSEIVADNTKVTQEYKDSLKDLGFSENELSECFDDNNGLVVKNAALLRKLVNQKREERKATIQTAKAMSQLQYKNTVGQLQQVIKAMALEVKANGLVSDSTQNTIGVLRSQLTALQQTIQQYALLELQLTDAANAYSEFEAAKERDAQLTYGDSMVDALGVINEGFKTGQVGTEAFQAAVEIVVPESEYANIDDVEQRMIAIHDYIDKNPLFADWFTIDEGQFSITQDNINNFVDDANTAGIFTNDSSGDFFLTDAIKNAKDPLKELVNQFNETFDTEVTEGSVLAMLTELEKYDASWGNIITDLTTTPLDRKINEATDALDKALTAQEEFILNGGDLNGQEYQDLCDAVDNANQALTKATENAENNAKTNIQVETVYAALLGKVKLTQEAANELAKSLGLVSENGEVPITVNDDGSISITNTALQQLKEKKDALEKTSIMDIQLRYDTISTQIDELQKYVDENLNFEDSEIAVSFGIKNKDEAEAKIAELTAEQKTISLNYDITATTSDQQSGVIEKLSTWETNGVTISIGANAEDARAVMEEFDKEMPEDKTAFFYADTEDADRALKVFDDKKLKDKEAIVDLPGIDLAIDNIETLADRLEKLPGKITITVTQNGDDLLNGTAHVNGSAYKGGSWGAPKTETALVGELGPEMLVRGNKWTTIGENGAEFTQIKKGDIIFNHKQTEDLLSKGYITGRGKAYASGTANKSGTAYYRTFDGYYGSGDVFENGSDKWKDPYSNFDNAADSLSSAADDISDSAEEFREVFDWIEIRIEEITDDLDLKGAKLENAVGYSKQNSIIDGMIKTNEDLYDNLLAGANKYYSYASKLLEKVPAEYRNAAQNGAIAIEEFVGEVDEKTLEAIQEYREWVQKGDGLTQQAEETLTEIVSLAKQAFDNIVADYDNKISIGDSKIDQLDAHNAYVETDLGSESAAIYQAMIKENNKNIAILEQQRNAMQAELNKRVEAGEIEKYSQAWYDAVNEISAVDTEIIKLKADTEDYQDAINELHWEHFDNLISRFESISEEAQNLIDILSEKDAFDEAGNWTDEGIASLGLYAQQMENAEVQAKKYEEEIKYLNKNWRALGYTEEEYIEKLDELKDGQYDAIKAYHDSKDAIADLTKERVEAIKEGIEKEIDAYDDLVNKKKEALDAEKDAYDFQKSIGEQQKNIFDIERQIAALSSDDSASARAKRAKLEADLAAERAKLNDMYYDRSVENQKKALDDEAENYKDARNKEIEGWDEYLKDTEKVVSDSLTVVQENTSAVYKTIQAMGKEYSLSITESITSPWKDGEKAIQSYSEKFGLSMSSTVEELKEVAKKYKEFIDEIEGYGSSAVKQSNENKKAYQEANKKSGNNNSQIGNSNTDKTIRIGGKIYAGNAKIYDYVGDKSGSKQYYSSDPVYKVLAIDGNWVQVRHKSSKSGVAGWFRKSDVKAYAKGTTGVLDDQWALIDELGEELVIRPQNGKLTYMTKGSSVVPANLTENLMQWGAIDPSAMLDRNRPQISASPSVVNNTSELKIDASVGTLLHVEHLDGNNPAEITKIVDKAWDKRMKELNGFVRKYSR